MHRKVSNLAIHIDLGTLWAMFALRIDDLSISSVTYDFCLKYKEEF